MITRLSPSHRSPDGWDQIPMGWWLGRAPVTLEFWVRFPNKRNQGKQEEPGKTAAQSVLKYRVPHGSHVIGTAVINTHTQ